MAGNGFCFIAYDGTVQGCGFLAMPAGNVKRQRFKEIYQNSPLFQSLRNPDLLQGRCGVCEFRVLCGGCRARALEMVGDYLAEEPYCIYEPKAAKRDSD